MYENGSGVRQDYAEAAKWYREAAERGDARAQYNLGILNRNGWGVPRDYNEAAKWYRKAAEQGDVDATRILGLAYYPGKWVPQDFVQFMTQPNGEIIISKGNLTFAVADHIPRLMDEFERNILRKYTPCRSKNLREIVHALAVVHTELILIHPFREGNGKTARMLATLMGLQSELPPLDFETMGGKRRKGYFAAVQAGMGGDYVPMEKIFSAVIRGTLRKRA